MQDCAAGIPLRKAPTPVAAPGLEISPWGFPANPLVRWDPCLASSDITSFVASARSQIQLLFRQRHSLGLQVPGAGASWFRAPAGSHELRSADSCS